MPRDIQVVFVKTAKVSGVLTQKDKKYHITFVYYIMFSISILVCAEDR